MAAYAYKKRRGAKRVARGPSVTSADREIHREGSFELQLTYMGDGAAFSMCSLCSQRESSCSFTTQTQ